MNMLILGGIPKLHTHYRDYARQLGYKVSFVEADEIGPRVQSLARKADVIVLITASATHMMEERVMAFARSQRIVMVNSKGVSSFKMALKRLKEDAL